MRHGLDLEEVVLGKHLVDRLEPQIRGVGQAPQGQEVRVRIPDPGDLKEIEYLCIFFFPRHLNDFYFLYKGQ